VNILAFVLLASLEFNGSTDKILATTTPVSAAPFSVCAKVNKDVTTDQAWFTISDVSAGSNFWTSRLKSDNTHEFHVRAGATQPTIDATASYAVDTWHSVCVVEASSTSHVVYLDGANSASSATDTAPAGIDHIVIGLLKTNAESAFFDGDIMDFAVWNRALTAAEIDIYHKFSGSCLKSGLVNYTKMIRDVQDVARGIAWDVTGTTVTPSPRIIYCS
jgi:hypothetical protein